MPHTSPEHTLSLPFPSPTSGLLIHRRKGHVSNRLNTQLSSVLAQIYPIIRQQKHKMVAETKWFVSKPKYAINLPMETHNGSSFQRQKNLILRLFPNHCLLLKENNNLVIIKEACKGLERLSTHYESRPHQDALAYLLYEAR